MATGGWFAKKRASIIGNYWFMVYEWKHLSKGVRKLEGNVDELKRHIKRHSIDDIAKDMAKIDDEIDTTLDEGHKLAFRDLLLLRRSILNLRILSRTFHKNIKGIEELEQEILKQVQEPKLKAAFKHLFEKSRDADVFTKNRVQELIKDVHSELQGEQRGLFDLRARLEGKKAVGLVFKGKPEGVMRMLWLRWGAIRSLRKNLKTEEKDEHVVEQDLKKLKEGLNKLLKDILSHHAKTEELKKAEKRDEKEIKEIAKKLKETFKAAEEVIKDSYKIFLFDLMLLKVSVEEIFKEERLDIELARKHEIPLVMAQNYFKKLEEDKVEAKKHLHDLEKFLLQLWNL